MQKRNLALFNFIFLNMTDKFLNILELLILAEQDHD